MPPYDPRANRPAPAAVTPDEPSAVDALLEKTADSDTADSATSDVVEAAPADASPQETIDLRDTTEAPSAPPSPTVNESPTSIARPVAIAVAGVVVVGIGWALVRRQRSRD